MSTFVKKYPAISLLVLAMIFGTAPALIVATGLLPPAAVQLEALSSSLAAIVLVIVEGRKGGLRELLGRPLIWRVGIQWWIFALFFMIVPSVASLYLYHLLGGLLPAILGYAVFVIAQSVQFTWLFNNPKGSVLLAAVFHGASNAWAGYLDVYRGHFGGILTVMALSVLITAVIAAMAGANDLSRTFKRNVLEIKDGQPDTAQPSIGKVTQPSGSR